MSSTKFVNIAKLMTTYKFEIEQLPNNLKCAKCKLVLKDACLLPCSCTFCRICIDDMMSNGVELCPGQSDDCKDSSLSCLTSDSRANNIISRLIVKCPNNGCGNEYELADMEGHLLECLRKSVECPFYELGCMQDTLPAEEMNGHLVQENRRHSEILIGILKQKNEDSKKEIKILKHELAVKDEQIKMIINQMIHLENENKSIAQGKEDLADQVKVLQEKLEREIYERRENEELGKARVIEHIDREIAAITAVIGANKDELDTEIRSVKEDIILINEEGAQSITNDLLFLKSREELIQELIGQVDARCEFVIDEDLSKVEWTSTTELKTSNYFTGVMHPYQYQLSTYNCVGSTGYLQIHLFIHMGRNDAQLTWPFEGRVVITVSDEDSRHKSKSISRQCRMNQPAARLCKGSNAFTFIHSELISAQVGLSSGVHVSCLIVPGAGR